MSFCLFLPIFIFLSIIFTFTFSRLSTPADPTTKVFETPPRYPAKFKITKALREARKRKREKIIPVPFMTIPDEIKIKILSYASEPELVEALRALLCVSKNIRYMTLQSCLPHLHIILNSRKRIQSFYSMCLVNPELVPYIHQMWVSPPSEEDQYLACAIIKACTGVRALACTALLLAAAVCSDTTLRHEYCQKLTLLEGAESDWDSKLPKPIATIFFGQLTHLRIIGEAIPKTIRCKKLIHLSYTYTLQEGELGMINVLTDVKRFPKLETLLVNQGRDWTAVDVKDGKWRRYSSDVQDLDLWKEGNG